MPRPKEFNPDDALEKAMQVFWHKGYEATSMEDLLTAMDLNRGSLYDTFGDKRQLFLKAIDRYCHGFVGRKILVARSTRASAFNTPSVYTRDDRGWPGRSATPRMPDRQHSYGAIAARERDRRHAPPGPKDG